MNSVTIGTTLQSLRENSGLSTTHVSLLLKSTYAIESNQADLLHYESGNKSPDISCFLALCSIYGCHDILHTFGYTKTRTTLDAPNTEENLILQKYRLLPTEEKSIILGALHIKKDKSLQRIPFWSAGKTLLQWTSTRNRTLGHYVLKSIPCQQFDIVLMPNQ